MQDIAGYIRVTHAGINNNSIYLKDLGGDTTYSGDRGKIPNYVPVGGSVDILMTSKTMASFKQGDIRGFVNLGYITAHLVRDLNAGSYEEISYDPFGTPTTSILYTDTGKTSIIEQRVWVYANGVLTTETITKYDESQNVEETVRYTYTYSNGLLVTVLEEIL